MADQSSFLKPILRDLVYGVDAWKKPVKAVATSNISLLGTQTIDGVAIGSRDEVLCVGQSSAAQNGIWVASTGAWTRRTDADASDKLFAGVRVAVTHGTAAGAAYRLMTTGRITVGTTAQTWALDSQATEGTPEDVDPTPDTLALRGSSGEIEAAYVEVTSHIQIGATADNRIQEAELTAAGQHRIGPNGRLWGYGSLGPSAYLLSYDNRVRATYQKQDYDADPTDALTSEVCIAATEFFGVEMHINAVHVAFSDAITADDTNYARISLRIRSAAGGSLVSEPWSLQTRITGTGATGNVVQYTSETGNLSLPLQTMASGTTLWVMIEKFGAGVALPPFLLTAWLLRRDSFE